MMGRMGGVCSSGGARRRVVGVSKGESACERHAFETERVKGGDSISKGLCGSGCALPCFKSMAPGR